MMSRIAGDNSTNIRTGGARTLAIVAALLTSVALIFTMFYRADAAEPANSYFQSTWQRTDQPVSSGQVDRTWLWGPDGFTGGMTEPYAESPGGERTVQYFDKSRMEITDPSAPTNSVWYVTNGLLVVELVTGRMQMGDNSFTQYQPADVNVAGDRDGLTGPTYATMAGLLDASPLADGSTITQRVDRNGNVTDDPSLSGFGVTADYLVSVPGIEHQVASPFWEFMNSSGTVYENGAYGDAPMFLSAFYATGYPITEAYWSNVKVAGTYQDVLLQCFERRCLTYTPGNSEGWQVEAGNVGQHYYEWRYGQISDDPLATQAPSPTATETEPVDGTPPASPTGEPIASPTATEVDDEPTATPTHEPYRDIRDWGDPVDPGTEFDGPSSVAIGPDGSIYVAEYGMDRVQRFTAEGAFIASWDGGGRIEDPESIAVDRSGRVYVSNYGSDRVLKFDGNGGYLDAIGDGLFVSPAGIAFDSSSNIYVVDAGSGLLLKFDRNGAFVEKLGDSGVAVEDLAGPIGVAIDGQDVIYVTDSGEDRIQKYGTDGTYLGGWGGPGSPFNTPYGIAVNDDGVVYVSDLGEDRVAVFDTGGTFLGQWGGAGSAHGKFDLPQYIAIDGDDNVYVVDLGNNRLQKFSATGSYLDSLSDGRRGRFADPTLGMAMDADGNVYLGDHIYNRIQVFDSSGNFQMEFGDSGSGTGQLDGVADIAASRDGYIYAVDVENSRVLKYRRNGTYLTEWSASVNQPVAVTVDPAGNVYVANSGNDRVLVFSASGSLLRSWGGSGDGDGKFNYPADIAVNSDYVYVVDHNDRVQVFNLMGDYLTEWGVTGDGEGEFDSPAGVAVDRDGNVFVVDTGNHRVQKFTSQGGYLTEFGSEGSGSGKFKNPVRAVISPDGAVYVLDPLSFRIQVFGQASTLN